MKEVPIYREKSKRATAVNERGPDLPIKGENTQ